MSHPRTKSPTHWISARIGVLVFIISADHMYMGMSGNHKGDDLQEAAALGAEHEEANIVTSLAVAGIPMPSKSNEGSVRSSKASSLFGSSGPASLKSEASTRSGRLESRAAPMQVLHLNI